MDLKSTFWKSRVISCRLAHVTISNCLSWCSVAGQASGHNSAQPTSFGQFFPRSQINMLECLLYLLWQIFAVDANPKALELAEISALDDTKLQGAVLRVGLGFEVTNVTSLF